MPRISRKLAVAGVTLASRAGLTGLSPVIFPSNLRHFEAVEADHQILPGRPIMANHGLAAYQNPIKIRSESPQVHLEAVRPYLAERCVVVLHDVEFSFLRNSVWSIKWPWKNDTWKGVGPRMVIQVLAFFFKRFEQPPGFSEHWMSQNNDDRLACNCWPDWVLTHVCPYLESHRKNAPVTVMV